MRKIIAAFSVAVSLSGCASWDTSSGVGSGVVSNAESINPASVQLTSATFDPKRYEKISDLRVTVNKTTILNADPTVADVEAKLRSDAARLGATEVVEVKVTGVSASPVSWGTRRGTGIAVRPR